MPDLPAVNEKWVPVQLTVKGNRAMLTIGDFQTEISHTALERDKNMVMLTFAHGELSVRNFRMNSSGTPAVKPASNAKTSVSKKRKNRTLVQIENAKPGTRDWMLTNTSVGTGKD